MKKTLLLALFSALSLHLTAQSAGDFRSKTTGNWNAASTWERYNGSAWVDAPGTPSNTDGVITIRSPHVVTVTANVTVDQTVIESGGEVIVNTGVIFTIAAGAGDDITVNGTLQNNGSLSIQSQPTPPPPRFGLVRVNGILVNSNQILGATSSTLFFGEGSIYRHAQDGGQLPLASWNQNSTCSITGIVSTPLVSGLNQNFGNFSWNCVSQTGFIDLDGNLTTVNGNLELISSGGAGVYLTAATNYTLNIGGNIIIEDYFGFNSSAPNVILNVGGDFNLTGIVDFTFSGDVTLNLDGNFTTSGGIMNLTYGGDANITINLKSDFELDPSTSVTQGGGTGTKVLNFTGASPQVYSASTELTEFDFIIKPSATVTLANNSFFAGSGDVILENLATLKVGSTHSSGAIQTVTSAGNIRVTGTRTYAAGSRIVYNGAAAQVIGSGFPTGGDVNLEIDNPTGVSMSGNLTVNQGRQLILTSGALAIGIHTLTLNGNLSGSGTLTGGNNANLFIGGGGNPVNLNFTSYPATLKNLTIDRSTEGPIIFGGNMQVLGTLSSIEGIMDISGRNFQISGPFAGGDAEFRTNASTVLRVNSGGGGTEFTGELKIQSGNTLDTLRINRVGVDVPTSSLFVARGLSLLAGTLMNTQNSIQMAAGGTVFRQSPGALQFAPGGSNPYNLVYGAGTFSSGPELPGSPSTQLNNFTVDGSGTKTITKEITINGNVNLNSGSLANPGFNVTMRGAVWNFNAGSYVPGSSLTRIDGITTIGGTGIKQFGGLLCLSGSILTLPADKLGISGLFEAESGATINHSSGTVLFNGASDQSVSVGGAALYNIEVDKSGGIVNLVTPLDLISTLDINSATVLNSRTEGNLRLLSSTDAGGGDARIAALFPGASISGNVRIQRFMSGEDLIWRLLTPPVNGASVANWQQFFKISGNFDGADPSVRGEPSMYIYDETVPGDGQLGWEAYPVATNQESITSGKGYLVAMSNKLNPITVEVSGPVNQGDFDFVDEIGISYTSTTGGDNDGWNLIGNPYPSQIRWSSIGWTFSETVGATAYVEDEPAGITRTFNRFTGSFNGNIAIGQGFWIRAEGGPIELIASEQVKTDGSATFYRTEPLTNHLALTLKRNGTNQEDYTYIHYREDATNAYDHQADGYKRANQIFGLYSMGDGGARLAINSRKLEDYITDTVFIGIMYIEAGDYTLEIKDLNSFDWNYTFVLKDNQTNTFTDIPQSEEPFLFSFSVPEDTEVNDTRFELYVKPIFTGLPNEPFSGISIYPNPAKDLFNIRGITLEELQDLYLIDAQGKSIYPNLLVSENAENEVQIDAGKLPKGIYLLRLQLKAGVLTRKILIE
jgi:hypothetical protein